LRRAAPGGGRVGRKRVDGRGARHGVRGEAPRAPWTSPDWSMRAGREGRHRCATCRQWFHPDARAGERQRVCSAECRRERSRAQGRRRRWKDLEGYRAAERVRQREHRAAVASGGERPRAGSVSRARMEAQGPETMEKILVAWDTASRLSRAGLQHALREILRDQGNCPRQVGQ
jgi:hypothetical protein